MADKSGKQAEGTEKPTLVGFSIPMRASIEDIIRAIRILSDSGGQAKISEIGTSFGTKSSDRTLLGWSLNAAIPFGLVKPHKRRAPYALSDDGKKLLGLTEDQQRAMLLPKFLGFEGYRKILVAMKNSQDKSLKKQAITDMWLQVRDNVKLTTRQYYTTTFASVGAWCGAITDTGQTCSLTPKGTTILEQILKGKEAVIPRQQPFGPLPTGPLTVPVTPSLAAATYCPHCGKSEIGVEDEELLNTLSSNGSHVLIIKTTYYCRGCSRAFSTIGQRLVGAGN